jgi:hypothetical protein
MIVNHKLPAVAGRNLRFFKVYVVLGPNHKSAPGQIKTVRLSSTVSSALVSAQFDRDAGGRATKITSLNISAQEEANGTRFLQELYKEAGALDDYAVWEAHQAAIEQGREVDPFPDDRLPPCVLEWRSRKGVAGDKFVIPPKGSEPVEDIEDDFENKLELASPSAPARRRRASAGSAGSVEAAVDG